jgi:hypothetical protein
MNSDPTHQLITDIFWLSVVEIVICTVSANFSVYKWSNIYMTRKQQLVVYQPYVLYGDEK